MIDKKNPVYLSYIINMLVMIAILMVAWAYTGGFYFPADDPYISLKQASNLLNGQFFTYSYNGEKTNSNTSVIYYFVSTLTVLLAKTTSTNVQELLESAVIFNLIFNFTS